MLALSPRRQLALGIALAALMTATRGHLVAALPGASWAVFLLAGIALRPAWAFPALLVEAVVIDAIAVGWAGVPDYCMTPAYAMLLPAYASLWLAGRWYAARHAETIAGLARLGAAALGGALACELFSGGGFYFLSGRFAATTLAGYGERFAQYFPAYLGSLLFWVGLALVAYLATSAARERRGSRLHARA